MKWFKYYKSISKINVGTEENPEWKDLLQEYGLQYSEANEEIVKKEAYNGEYTIVEDDTPEPEIPSDDDTSVWDELDAAYQRGVDSV